SLLNHFFSMPHPPPTSTLFPYTTLFRSTVFPDNGRKSLPSIYGQYVLLDGETGAPLALLDGTMLTKRRTACASGLASRYLSRPDAARLLMIGTGALAPQLIRVHSKVRPIREVAIWGRRPEEAQRLAH